MGEDGLCPQGVSHSAAGIRQILRNYTAGEKVMNGPRRVIDLPARRKHPGAIRTPSRRLPEGLIELVWVRDGGWGAGVSKELSR